VDAVYVIMNLIGCSACGVVYYKYVIHVSRVKEYVFGIK